MKAYKKIMFVMLIALIALSTLSVFVGLANAALSQQGSISANNSGVGETATYTFTVNNDGPDNLVNATITIPGYTNIRNLEITQQPPSQAWSISEDGTYIYLNQTGQGLSTGQSLTFTFDATNPPMAGTYIWAINAAGTDGTTTSEATSNITSTVNITSMLPAFMIFGIAVGIAFLNTGINRILINYFIGWEQYHVMQKEIAEFRSEQMAAARANDRKQMEKLKRKQSQINNMTTKMMKPQMAQIGISFIYFAVWIFLLIPTFGSTSLAYLPGFGAISVIYLYPILSFFLSIFTQRIIGTMPIEPR
jgi:uncharacterized membrane protein (DUF106 family)